jgi:colanic acid biosynthesis glycosyl transferase WcaI
MRIVLVSLNFSPELTGIGKYSGEMAAGLAERGHDVTVLCAPPYYPAWKVQSGYSNSRYTCENPQQGLRVIRCPIWVPRQPSGLSRLLHLASFAVSSFLMLLRLLWWRPQAVFLVAPALACAPGVILYSWLVKARSWLHVQDFEVDAAFSLGLLRTPGLKRLALSIERALMRRFDVVSTISRRMSALLVAKGVDLARVELLPNAADLRGLQAGPRSEDMRDRLGIPQSHTVCLYSGSLNRKQGLGVLIEALEHLPVDSPVSLVICGEGELREELEVAARNVPNVHFMGLRPAGELNELLNLADIHLLPQLPGAADLVMPSKLVGMLASGRPVVAAALPGSEIAAIVSHCGVVVEPENAGAFARAISLLAADAEMRNRLGQAARQHAEQSLDAAKVFEGLHLRLQALERPRPLFVPAIASPKIQAQDPPPSVLGAKQAPR